MIKCTECGTILFSTALVCSKCQRLVSGDAEKIVLYTGESKNTRKVARVNTGTTNSAFATGLILTLAVPVLLSFLH